MAEIGRQNEQLRRCPAEAVLQVGEAEALASIEEYSV